MAFSRSSIREQEPDGACFSRRVGAPVALKVHLGTISCSILAHEIADPAGCRPFPGSSTDYHQDAVAGRLLSVAQPEVTELRTARPGTCPATWKGCGRGSGQGGTPYATLPALLHTLGTPAQTCM